MFLTRRSRGLQLALTCFALAASSGCGFLFSKGPPAGHEQLDYFACTEGDVGPILDIVWGGLNVLGVLVIAADPQEYEATYGTDASAGMAIGLAWGGVSTVAAVTGFNRSKKCREAKALLAQRQAQARPAAVTSPATDAPVVQAVVVTPQSDTLLIGATLQLVATAHHSSGVAIPGRSFIWSSSNDAVASVSSAGLVSAQASGSVVIAASTANVVGVARLTIVEVRE